MCGRFTLRASPEALARHFDLAERPSLFDRFNIAPSQTIPAIGLKRDGRTRALSLLKWGLEKSGFGDGPKPINARAETVARVPLFAESFRLRRCLIPADGWYEWKKQGRGKQPFHFHLPDGGLFAFAGLYEVKGGDATCCIITTKAGAAVRPVHDRMPAALRPDDYGRWLSAETPATDLRAMIADFQDGPFAVDAVSSFVNSARNEGPECLAPAGAA